MHRFKLKLIYLFCCLLTGSGLAAQDASSYFVYIQHEKQQPFYVKLDGKVLSSSLKGYVILPKLHAGKVPVTIGFPKSESAEQQFVIRLNGSRDYGYLLKSTGDNDYALYDLQTFATLKSGGGGAAIAASAAAEEVTVTRLSDESASPEQKELMNNVQADVEAALNKKADTAPEGKTAAAEPKKKGSFAQALDKVVTDDRPEDMPLELAKPKPVAAPLTEVTETVVLENTTAEPAKKLTKKQRRQQQKDREALTEEEQALLSSVMEDEKKAAADEALQASDTVAVIDGDFTPVAAAPKKDKKAKKKNNQPEPEFIDFGEAKPGAASEAAVPVAAEVVEETTEVSAKDARDAKRQKRKAEREAAMRESDMRDSIANAEYNKDMVAEPAAKKPVLNMVNSDCEKVLEVDAFRKLLRTMNGKKTDEEMVDAFRKGTRNVCVSSEQVRALTQLIATEDNRYQLLDAAYARTYDTNNFGGLADLLKEDYYKGRFRAMLKK